MRTYELMLLLPPSAEEAQVDEKLSLCESLVKEAGGEFKDVTRWGRRPLAYPIRHENEAYYAIVRFQSSGSTNIELKRRLRLDPEVSRFLLIRLDQEMRYAEKHADKREAKRPAGTETDAGAETETGTETDARTETETGTETSAGAETDAGAPENSTTESREKETS